jgi:hypothetical protein
VADRPPSFHERLIAARWAIVRARIPLPVLTHSESYSDIPRTLRRAAPRRAAPCRLTIIQLGADLAPQIEIELTATRVGDTRPDVEPRGYYPSGERLVVRCRSDGSVTSNDNVKTFFQRRNVHIFFKIIIMSKLFDRR